MKTKQVVSVFFLLLMCLTAYSPASASLRDLFQANRLDSEAVLYLTNGDILHGEVLNERFGIYTPYGYLQVPAQSCAGIFFGGAVNNREMIVS